MVNFRNGALLALGLLAVYLPALHGGWVWDDGAWVGEPAHLHKDLHGLLAMWTSPTALQQYFPVTGTSFWLDHQLWGNWTLPYHVENVLLHALSAVLLAHLLTKLKAPFPWAAAAVFAFHPLMVESVAWVTERKNVLARALSLSSVLAYGRYAGLWEATGQGSARWWWCAFAICVAALLAKITAFVVPPALFLLLWWRGRGVAWKPLVPFFLVAVSLGLLISWLEKHHVGAHGAEFAMPWSERTLVAGRVTWFYLGKLMWPAGLSPFYERWVVDGSLWSTWAHPVSLGGAVALLFWKRVRLPRGLWAVLGIALTSLLPVLGFLPVYGMLYSFVADRWVQMAAVPVIASLAWCPLLGRIRLLPWIMVLIYCPLVWQRAQDYAGMRAYWESALKKTPSCWLACQELSRLAHMEGKEAEAVKLAQRVVEMRPQDGYAQSNLGALLMELRRPDEALPTLQRAVELEPRLKGAHYNLANVWIMKGEMARAQAALEEELATGAELPDALNNLGVLLLQQQQTARALDLFQRAVASAPSSMSAHTNLALALNQLGRTGESIAAYEHSLTLGKPDVSTLNNLAWTLATAREDKDRNGLRAVDLAQQALEVTSTRTPQLLRTLAAAQAAVGRFEEAASLAKEAGADEDAALYTQRRALRQ